MRYQAGQVLSERRKGAVLWRARVSADRNRLELIGIVEASTTPTEVEPLTQAELCALLDETHDARD